MLFTVEIDEEWLDVLDSLIRMTLGDAKTGLIRGSTAAPEDVLTVSIFFQFRLQRLRLALSRKENGIVRFPYDLEPRELADYWNSHDEVRPPSCLSNEVEECLVPRCYSCGIEAREWDTACFDCGGPVG